MCMCVCAYIAQIPWRLVGILLLPEWLLLFAWDVILYLFLVKIHNYQHVEAGETSRECKGRREWILCEQ